jgi:hypothetical protein
VVSFGLRLARILGVGWDLLISLSWYCDCAVDEMVEAEPLETVGDDILFRCRGRVREGTVRTLRGMNGACDAS